MRRILTIVALLVAVATNSAGAQQKVDAGHRAALDVAIRLVGPLAKVRVTGWERDSISVTGTLPKGARFENMHGGDPRLPVRGVKMFVEPADAKAAPEGTLELRVPFGARVNLVLGSADVETTGITGELDIVVLGGSVRVNGNQRVLKVDAIDATVIVDGSPAWVRLKSAEGDVVMRGGSQDAVYSTVSGNIRVSDGALDRAKFESVTGSVTFAGDLVRNASLDIDTHSGAIDVQLSLKASVVTNAITSTGTIENLLNKQMAARGRDGRGQEITVGLANGEGQIFIRTFKGHIRLARR